MLRFDPKTKKFYGKPTKITEKEKSRLNKLVRSGVMSIDICPSQELLDDVADYRSKHKCNEAVYDFLRERGLIDE